MKLGSTLSAWVIGALMLLVIVACGPVAAPPEPTAQAVATRVATAVQPVGIPVAAAVSPVATMAGPVATQAAEVASPVATRAAEAASPIATSVAAWPVEIVGWQASPTDASLTLRNDGRATVDLTGWRVRIGSRMATLPSSAQLAPGESLTIHAAHGTSSATDIYLGDEGVALLQGIQPGAPLTLYDGQGNVVREAVIPGR